MRRKKGGEEKKVMPGYTRVFTLVGGGLFGGDVFKNPGRCIFFHLFCILVCFQRQCTCYETVGGELSFHVSRTENLSSIFCHAGYDKALAATNLKFVVSVVARDA